MKCFLIFICTAFLIVQQRILVGMNYYFILQEMLFYIYKKRVSRLVGKVLFHVLHLADNDF